MSRASLSTHYSSLITHHWLRADPWLLVFVALVGVLVYLTLVPLIILLLSSLQDERGQWTLAQFATAFSSPSFLRPIQNTLVVALAAGALAGAGGTPLAWLVARTHMPPRRPGPFMGICSFLTPPLLPADALGLLARPHPRRPRL